MLPKKEGTGESPIKIRVAILLTANLPFDRRDRLNDGPFCHFHCKRVEQEPVELLFFSFF